MKTIAAFYFDSMTLRNWADRYGQTYRTAQPFPHVVIDDFLSDEVIRLLSDELPGPDEIEWAFWVLDGTGRKTHDSHGCQSAPSSGSIPPAAQFDSVLERWLGGGVWGAS
jgi:hypothetical protein